MVDGHFIAYLGCPGEAFSVSGLPMLNGVQYQVESHCACCYQPIRLSYFGPELQTPTDELPTVAVVGNPHMWEYGVPADRVCDDFHFTLDDAHAERFGRRISRRQSDHEIGAAGGIEPTDFAAPYARPGFAGMARRRDAHERFRQRRRRHQRVARC